MAATSNEVELQVAFGASLVVGLGTSMLDIRDTTRGVGGPLSIGLIAVFFVVRVLNVLPTGVQAILPILAFTFLGAWMAPFSVSLIRRIRRIRTKG